MNVVTWPPPISRSVVGARGFCRVWLDAYEVVSWAGAEHNMVDLIQSAPILAQASSYAPAVVDGACVISLVDRRVCFRALWPWCLACETPVHSPHEYSVLVHSLWKAGLACEPRGRGVLRARHPCLLFFFHECSVLAH